MTKARLGAVLAIALSCTPFSPIAQAVAQQVVTITLQDPSGDSSVSSMVMKTDGPTVNAGSLTLQRGSSLRRNRVAVALSGSDPGQVAESRRTVSAAGR